MNKKEDDLYEQLKDKTFYGGELTAEELSYVLSKIEFFTEKEKAPAELTAYLSILAKTTGSRYRDLIEKYLYSDEPIVSSEALFLLCEIMGLRKEYHKEIKAFMQKGFEDMRTQAIWCAGYYLHYHADVEMVRILLQIVENYRDCDEVREEAYQVLRRGTGCEDEFEDKGIIERIDEGSIDSKVLAAARLLIS